MKKIIVSILLLIFTSSFSFGAEDIFNISTVNGKKLTLRGTDDGIIVDQYKGKIVFLEFWVLGVPLFAEHSTPCKDARKV